MPTSGYSVSRLRDVIKAVTAQSTFTETQCVDVPLRFENLEGGQTVWAHLDATIRADGLGDALARPDEI